VIFVNSKMRLKSKSKSQALCEWEFCANENGTCTASINTIIRYGSGSTWIIVPVNAGVVQCNNSAMGKDPLYGTVKQCQLLNSNDQFVDCAQENGSCAPSNPNYRLIVAYGQGSNWTYQEFATSPVPCNNSVFGDPDYGVVKKCQYIYNQCNSCWKNMAAENGQVTITALSAVKYGSGTNFLYSTQSSNFSCSNTYFGSDPDYGVVKECDVLNTNQQFTSCAAENGTCNASASKAVLVRYGANGKYAFKEFSAGPVACNNSVFGDPNYGTVKACDFIYTEGACN